MPFDWMEPKRNPAFTKTLKAKREAMYHRELEERAALLHRLGHSRADVKARLAANVGWDFESGGGAGHAAAGGAGGDGDGHEKRQLQAALSAILDREYGGAPRAPRTKGEAK